MPYFVFKVFTNKTCEQIGEFDQYKAARELARETRESTTLQDNCSVKVMHAKDSAEAETLVLTARDRPILMEQEK